MISKALKIAYTAHQNQIDKGGIPYVQHPIRVALSCMTDDEKIGVSPKTRLYSFL